MGCTVCQTGPLKPQLKKLTIKHHLSKAGGRLSAAELEVVWDGTPLRERVVPPVNFSPAVDPIVLKWGATAGKDRYGPHGFEACMAPASDELFMNEADDFESAFKTDQCYLTEQCGGHIHADARDFCIDDICKLLQLYRYLEPGLFKMLPAWRRGLGQCERLADYYMDYGLSSVKGITTATAFKEKLDAGNNHHRGGRGLRGNWHERHCALNVSSLFQHGTVELRIPPGLLRSVDITGWASVFRAIMDQAKSTRFYRLKLREITATKQPAVADSLAELNLILSKKAPAALEWAKDQQEHASRNWLQNRRFN